MATEIMNVICQLNKKSKLRLAQEKHNLRDAYSKDKLEFQCFFFSPRTITYTMYQTFSNTI